MGPGGFIFGSDGRHLAFEMDTPRERTVVVDGVKGPAFDEVTEGPTICADGHLEYLGIRGPETRRIISRVTVKGVEPPTQNQH
jgi:hypothetical protein